MPKTPKTTELNSPLNWTEHNWVCGDKYYVSSCPRRRGSSFNEWNSSIISHLSLSIRGNDTDLVTELTGTSWSCANTAMAIMLKLRLHNWSSQTNRWDHLSFIYSLWHTTQAISVLAKVSLPTTPPVSVLVAAADWSVHTFSGWGSQTRWDNTSCENPHWQVKSGNFN